MALPQAIVKDFGGTVTVDVLDTIYANSTPTVTIKGPDATVWVNAATVTADSVATTLGAVVAAGAESVTVANSTGITVGREYSVGNGTSAPKDRVRVEGVDNTTITLCAPVRYAQANGAAFVGTRLSYAVNSSSCNTLFWDGHAEWSYYNSANTSSKEWTTVECTLKTLHRLATAQHVFIRDPKAYRKIDAELSWDTLLDAAFELLLVKLGGKCRTLVGSDMLIEGTVLQSLVMMSANYGPEHVAQREYYEKELQSEIAAIQCRAADLDQDGEITDGERLFSSPRVDRA